MTMQKPNDTYYYYKAIRSQVAIFMSLFKSMKVVDVPTETDGTLSQSVETPIDISYTPQEVKLYEQLYENTDPNSKFDTKVPRFSVSITNISYDQSRALNFYRTRRIKQNSAQYNDRMPIPYNIGVKLGILTKYETHLDQIVENIVPFFAPYILIKMKENKTYLETISRELKIDFSGEVERDVPIFWSELDRRILRGDLNFTIRGWVYKPITEQPGPILHIPIRFFKSDDFAIENLLETVEVSGPNWPS